LKSPPEGDRRGRVPAQVSIGATFVGMAEQVAIADVMQAGYFRAFLGDERAELRSYLAVQVKALTARAATGDVRGVSQVRRSVRAAENELKAIDRMVAALDWRFPDEHVVRR
jgi:hypothetical protein